jgi:hypothetical protein
LREGAGKRSQADPERGVVRSGDAASRLCPINSRRSGREPPLPLRRGARLPRLRPSPTPPRARLRPRRIGEVDILVAVHVDQARAGTTLVHHRIGDVVAEVAADAPGDGIDGPPSTSQQADPAHVDALHRRRSNLCQAEEDQEASAFARTHVDLDDCQAKKSPERRGVKSLSSATPFRVQYRPLGA